MRFSERTAWESDDSEYTVALAAARLTRTLLDLTVANPTHCGFEIEETALLEPLRNASAVRYSPVPFGLLAAREAVAGYYRDHEAPLAPERICLTASTSEAYGFLFQLLCDAGDEILVARPSYPLFNVLARLHGVQLREYPLFYDPGHSVGTVPQVDALGAWSIDLDALRDAVTERTRAILVVHPNNPTGNFVSGPERSALEQLCTERGLALIVDEVFLDFALPGTQARSFAEGESSALCFVLSGLSKVCALPQMKLSWIVAKGPAEDVRRALDRLEIIADTYLSLSAPVQYALPAWLASRTQVQRRIRDRLVCNLARLDLRLQAGTATRLALEGGWTTVLRVPRTVQGTEFTLACLERDVIVQTGQLYGLPEGRIVLSLLTPEPVWTEGLLRLPCD